MTGKTLLRLRQQHARRALLTKIYEPASRLRKGSAEYDRPAKSGRLWEDYFQPCSSLLMGYIGVQRETRDMLAKIDERRALLPTLALSRHLFPEFAQQSVMIENNPLRVSDAFGIQKSLDQRGVFGQFGMSRMPSSELARMSIPQTEYNENSLTVELKNHIIASQWVADKAAFKLGTTGVSESEVRDLAAASIKCTSSEAVHDLAWGGRVPPGGYRKLPVQVRSNHLAVFPYPQEVPACVRRFFEWRDAQHEARELHPLVLACQMTAYFVQIHPFPDGNGRVSRMIMQDYMARQGYLPAIIKDLERGEYIRMISSACEGKPRDFARAVLEAQLALVCCDGKD